MQFTPYESENVIFIDTEFSSLDPNIGELLSIGIVKLSGEELYLELEYDGVYSEWVKDHLLNTLTDKKVSRADAIREIQTFIGDGLPFAVAFVDNYDHLYMVKLFGSNDAIPYRWLTIDFASILFAMGSNPVKFLADEKGAASFYKKLGINIQNYRQHHALDDARLLRDVWLKMLHSKFDS